MSDTTSNPIPEIAADAAVGADSGTAESHGIDWQAVVSSPAFVPGVVVLAGLVALFWNMIKFLPTLWMSEDGYYSHGFLVPLISGYIVYKSWPKLKDREVKPQYWAALLMGLCLFGAYVAAAVNIYAIASGMFVGLLLSSVLFVAGWKWLAGLFWPIVYLFFALPVFQTFISTYTNPLQVASTKVAFQLLSLTGFRPYAEDATTVHLANFTLNIAVPCSGLKLLLALGAFSMFFMLVANLRVWANVVMVALWLPLALLINGLRIALIGVVGNTWGQQAGLAFHDYSGYITLLVCFFILFRVARGLGWKD